MCIWTTTLRLIPIRWMQCFGATVSVMSICCLIQSPLLGQDIPEPLRGYSRFEEIESRLKRLESPHATLRSLGITSGKRNIWLLTLASDPNQNRPAILIVGNVYAPHVIGREIATRIAEQLALKADSDEKIKSLLTSHTVYIIPSPTPDATEKNFRFPVRQVTGNSTTTDDDRDFEIGEDGPLDLNQDGWITMMRIKEQFGTHRAHPKDPRVLIPIDPKKNEIGEFRLLVESRDNDYDENFGEDASDGVDFNRNFTFEYSYFGKNTGPHQVSEVESRAVADFMYDHPNIAAVLCFTPEDNLFQTWKGSSQTDSARIKTKVLTSDQQHLDALAEIFRKLHGAKSTHQSPNGEGSFSEFAYFHFGRWTFASKAWFIPQAEKEKDKNKDKDKDSKAEAPSSDSKLASKELDKDDKRGMDELAALAWFESQGISGFVPWQSVNHPDFPGKEVEVGGFKPLFLLNPPANQIDSLVQPHMSFLSELVDRWPKLEVREIKAIDQGNGLYDIRCKIVNTGLLPTMPEMGSINRQWYPAQVKLVGAENAKMIEGSPRVAVGRLAENGGAKEVRWVLLLDKGRPAEFKIQIAAPTLHPVEKIVEFPKQ